MNLPGLFSRTKHAFSGKTEKFTMTREALERDPNVRLFLESSGLHSIRDSLVYVQEKLNEAEASKDAWAFGEIKKHIDYFASKSGVDLKEIAAGTDFAIPDKAIFLDFVKNCQNVCSQITPAFFERTDELPDSVSAAIVNAEKSLQGWCSREKAVALAKFVLTEKPATCVEIGVFGGRSLVPVAAALRHNSHGSIYGIETWSPAIATEYVTSDTNDDWWRSIDFHNIKRSFYQFIAEHDLTSQVKMVEATSASAASLFTTIDLLHIDGAHSMYNAAEDVTLYAKKVPPNGMIVLDDADWPTTRPAQEILKSICDLTYELIDDNGHVAVMFFRKR